jgi:hypothetical protein
MWGFSGLAEEIAVSQVGLRSILFVTESVSQSASHSVSHSSSQSSSQPLISKTISQPLNLPATQPFIQPLNQPFIQPLSQSAIQSASQPASIDTRPVEALHLKTQVRTSGTVQYSTWCRVVSQMSFRRNCLFVLQM